ncbi:GNAT family N-acetyltransferase [Pelagibius litoralis]|uniref:GNAT family N-acetyltransferase n=1 Tax=Pelagibius litoralis TaxID=374515 RepID=A0A967EYS8_9PROT|nr:GNAT family N-acetyltransferase [Pelagibius litoralis]NIA69908.1 GNAT family N-acetyltransferase [Pelagibius litoralis]
MTGDQAQSPKDVTVRLAGKADAQAVYSLIVELARSRDAMDKVISSVADIARDGFGADPAFEALIAEVGGEAVGLCLFFGSYSTWRGRRGLYVQDLIVADSARGLGVGRRLLAETAAIARARGGSYLRLSVDDDNTRAQAFYQRTGLSHSQPEQIYVLNESAFAELAASAKGTDA